MMAGNYSPLAGRSYYESSSRKLSREERENLYQDKDVKFTAFSPRPIQKLTQKRMPKTLASIKMHHKLRTSIPDSTHLDASEPYQAWIEAGQRGPPFPPRWDADYDSNTWRNFRLTKDIKLDPSGKNITELIASMYPINVPPHSELGENNYAKFLREVPMIRDKKKCTIAISKSELNLEEFQKLRIRSEVRVPPLDDQGKIRPPTKFKKYEHRYLTTPETTTVQLRHMTQTERDIERNILGTRQKLHYPRIWKLSYHQNNPEYDKVKKELEERRHGTKKQKSQIIFYQPVR
ncbi:testis-expressed protein 52-like [Saccoglossus kowalevskii]|uniref:Uncharacterized protein ENSP00000372125 homolog n=1 Tax=Saccoglossus kowalevskii TaxID=10224 RepID=A0ABM0GZ71_SACKO|nr:PREDICTED: uncharacterized protein ENSP00000372125 homolog [Saccoglossus kowalevskii]